MFSLRVSTKITTLAFVATCALLVQAEPPRGWHIAGSQPAEYETGVDPATPYNRTTAFLKSKSPTGAGFGTLMQEFRAEHYCGKRIRFSAFVKAVGVQYWTGLWMRVDKGPRQVAFDNMRDRAITGTTNWQRYDVVLDVPQDSTGISFGVLLVGAGEVRISEAKFDIVGPNIPTTGTAMTQEPDEPVNLDFER